MRRDLIIASSDILGEIIANYLNQYLNLKKEDNNITFLKPALKFSFLSFRFTSDMLAYGCTRLEIGVQSVYEDVARDTNR